MFVARGCVRALTNYILLVDPAENLWLVGCKDMERLFRGFRVRITRLFGHFPNDTARDRLSNRIVFQANRPL